MISWADPTSLLLLAGGLLGAFLRVALSSAPTWSRPTIYHVLLGGAVSVMVPAMLKAFFSLELVGPPLFLVCTGLVVGGFGNYILIAALWKAGVFKDDPRAAGPNGGTK